MSLVLLLGCGASGDTVELATSTYTGRPEVPSILRDVSLIDDDLAFTRPYVPGHRTSMDGRVAVRVQGGTSDIDRLSTHLSFFLFAPEKLDEPILTGPNGPAIVADPVPFDVPFPPALEPGVFRLGHHAICDPTTPDPQPGEQPNPYACGDDDCYDLTIISSTSPGLAAQIWGTPVTVRVSNPKTAQAQIEDVQLGEPVMGAFIQASTEWTEPAVTQDGRLMTGRLGRVPRAWENPNTGETFVRPYDLAYSVLPADAEPCDVTAWTDFHPMSHAPYDPQMVGTYGLAAYPFRDTEGELIPDGEDMGGTYPWVDRQGANLFMTGMHGRLSEQSETDFPRTCVHPGCEQLTENTDFDRGFMVAGLWTHGKLVYLDGMLNSVDWAVGVTPQAHWNVELYQDQAGQGVDVRVGGGRFIGEFRENGPYPAGYTHNANILDSLQNTANFREQALPVTPRDVVWVMSNGVVTDEVAFDDMLDPNALIVSNMVASVTQLYNEAGESTSMPVNHTGQVRELSGVPGLLATYDLEYGAMAPIHVQNGATSLTWQVPAYGHIDAGRTRIEPVALGGIEGRGLWMTGDVGVRYPLAAQAGVNDQPAYLGVFVDDRSGEARELFRFSDGTGVVLAGDEVLYVDGDELVHRVEVPATEGWRHLAWRFEPGHTGITLLVDGMPHDRYEGDALFPFEGDLVVGRSSMPWSGFRGWIDDLFLTLHEPNAEVACNHAKGTLVQLESGGEGPDWAHEEIAAAAGLSAGRFACHTDYTDDYRAHLKALPEASTSVRTQILFPEGPLVAGSPRPDSSDNTFCTSCHTAEGRGGLGLGALVASSEPAELDRRRQPHQPPRRVFGHVPADWIAPGRPAEALVAPAEGLLIDPLVIPAVP